jgi:hypothetical protein
MQLRPYLMSSASRALQISEYGARGRTAIAASARARLSGESIAIPMMLRVGFSASYFAVATDRNSGECITTMSGYCRCSASVVPGRSVDLITAVLPLPTRPSTSRTMLSSNPVGVVGVGTAMNTMSQAASWLALPV